MASRVSLVALVFALLASTGARADSEKRAVPDYDGRGNPDAHVHRARVGRVPTVAPTTERTTEVEAAVPLRAATPS